MNRRAYRLPLIGRPIGYHKSYSSQHTKDLCLRDLYSVITNMTLVDSTKERSMICAMLNGSSPKVSTRCIALPRHMREAQIQLTHKKQRLRTKRDSNTNTSGNTSKRMCITVNMGGSVPSVSGNCKLAPKKTPSRAKTEWKISPTAMRSHRNALLT